LFLNEDDFSRFKNKYNGYSWRTDRDFGAADEKTTEGRVVTYFNPFLVTCSCQEKTMDVPFWVRTASDSLIKTFPHMRSVDVPVQVPINSLTKVRTPDSIANSVDPRDSACFLLELGYATIKACDRTKMTVTLDYPNEEIRNHLHDEHITAFVNFIVKQTPMKTLEEAREALNNQLDLAPLLKLMNSVAPSQHLQGWHKEENSWTISIIRMLTYLGFKCTPEEVSSLGRSDIQLYLDEFQVAMVIELKRAKRANEVVSRAEQALNQIVEKQYGTGAFFRSMGEIKNWMFVGLVVDDKKREMSFFAQQTWNSTRDTLISRKDVDLTGLKKE
jgi:hypothetical protein